MENLRKWNWLKPSEVYSMLKFWYNSTLPIISTFSNPPQSGDLFFIKKSQFRRWRQDGHNYISRKTNNCTREDRENYTFESEIIICTYVHGSGVCPDCKKPYLIICPDCSKTITSILFHRRAYWLLSNPEIILVHYLDESQKAVHQESDSSVLPGQNSAEEQIKRLEEILRQIDYEQISQVRIIDFSPEWSDIHGGCKILICIDPPLIVPNPQNLFIAFGSVLVNAESVQLGVLKCFTPAHDSGIVELFIIYENKEITSCRKEFEFKVVRIVEMSNLKVEWWEREKSELEKELVNELNVDIEEMPHEENFDEDFFLTQFAKVVVKTEWEKLRENGRGFLHYICALGLVRIIRACKMKIFHVDLKDSTGMTPIDIAANKHYYECAYELIKISKFRKHKHTDEESFTERIQKIQSHVRAWLQLKQFRNLKRAAKTFQKTFRGMVARRNFKYQKQAAIVIQKSVRKWLMSEHHKIDP